MPISPEVAAFIDRLNQEFDEIEQEATEGVPGQTFIVPFARQS